MAFEFALRQTVHRLFVVVGAAALLVSGSAHADPTPADRETARGLMNQGDRRFDAKDYEQALKAYQGANAIMGVPTTAMGVARAQAALGHIVEARDAAIQVIRMPVKSHEPAPLVRAREAADQLARELASRIPSIQVAVSGPPPSADVRVTLDEDVVAPTLLKLPLKTNPGKHVLRASLAGFEDAAADVALQEGENASITLALKASVAPLSATRSGAPARADWGLSAQDADDGRPSRHPNWPLVYAGFGIGAAGLIAGGAAGILHLNQVANLKRDYCSGGSACRPGYQAQIDAVRPTAEVADVAFIVGAIGVGAGIVGLLLSKQTGEHPSPETRGTSAWLEPEFGLGSIGARGGF